MLKITNLHATVGDTEILKGLSLSIKAGEVHAIMGPNGAGKSTLGYVLAGREGYKATSGKVEFEGKNLLDMLPEQRALNGLFLAFQYPIEIPGVPTTTFLRAAVNARRKHLGQKEIDAMTFMKLVREKAKALGINEEILKRPLNSGFSGGEKKRCEALQMALLEPKLAVLDETDSGLDIDALKAVAEGINSLRSPERAMLVITHYQRLLEFVKPDFVHIMNAGRIVQSGGPELAIKLEKEGYAGFGIRE